MILPRSAWDLMNPLDLERRAAFRRNRIHERDRRASRPDSCGDVLGWTLRLAAATTAATECRRGEIHRLPVDRELRDVEAVCLFRGHPRRGTRHAEQKVIHVETHHDARER